MDFMFAMKRIYKGQKAHPVPTLYHKVILQESLFRAKLPVDETSLPDFISKMNQILWSLPKSDNRYSTIFYV